MPRSLAQSMRAHWRTLARACVTLFVYDVFISYARRDGRRYARALHRHLERKGIVCFLDRDEVLAGSELTPTLATALKKSRLLLLVATGPAAQSPYVQLEIQAFLRTGKPIVPVDFAGSFSKGDWPLLQPRNLVWLDELPAALEGRPSAEVLSGVRQHLKSTGSRVFAQRLIALVAVALAALAGGAWWSNQQAARQALQRDAAQLSARAALAFDVDLNPLRSLALQVTAMSLHRSVEAGQLLSRVLPFTRRPLYGRKIARLAQRVSFSSRGRYLVVVGRLDTPHDVLTVLDAGTLQEVWRAERPWVVTAVISPDERLLAWSDGGSCLSVAEIESGRPVTCLPHAGASRAEFSTDGKTLMTASRATAHAQGDSVAVWDTGSWHRRAEFSAPGGIWSVSFTGDGAVAALGLKASKEGEPIACLWNTRESQCRAVRSLEEAPRNGRLWESADVEFSLDSQLLLVAEQTQITVVETSTGLQRQRLSDSTGFAHVRFHPSGQALMAANSFGLVTLYPAQSSPSSPTIAQLQHPSRVVAAAFTTDGFNLVTTAEDGIARVWDAGVSRDDYNDFVQSTRFTGIATHGANLTPIYRSRAQRIDGIGIAPDGKSFATAGGDGWVHVWNLEPEPEVAWSRHGQSVTAVSATSRGDVLITAGEFSGRAWSLDPLRLRTRLRRHGNDLTGAAVSRDGSVSITTGSDGVVFVFAGPDLKFARQIEHEPGAERLVRAALAADGSTIATTSNDQIVRLWRVQDGMLMSQRHFDSQVLALALDPSASAVAIASGGVIAIRDTGGEWPERIAVATASPPRVLQLTESWLAAGSSDGSVRIWNATTGRERWSALHADVATAVSFSADEQRLASGSHDRTVRIWNTTNGVELARLAFPFRVNAVAFVRDSAAIIAGGENYVQESPWRPEDLISVACRHLAGLPAESWARLVGDVEPNVCALSVAP